MYLKCYSFYNGTVFARQNQGSNFHISEPRSRTKSHPSGRYLFLAPLVYLDWFKRPVIEMALLDHLQ